MKAYKAKFGHPDSGPTERLIGADSMAQAGRKADAASDADKKLGECLLLELTEEVIL